MTNLRHKSSVDDIDIGDRFKDDKGVLVEIVNFNGSQTIVYRAVGKPHDAPTHELAKTPALLAKIRLQILEEAKVVDGGH